MISAPTRKRRGRPPLTAEQKLWRRYLANRNSVTARNELAAHYLADVRRAAERFTGTRNIGMFCSADELVGHGTEGLLQALARFEPERGLRFMTYAMPRINGAMLDGLRELDERGRNWRQRANLIRSAIEQLTKQLGRRPHADEIQAACPLVPPENIIEVLNLYTDPSLDAATTGDMPGGEPIERLQSFAQSLPDRRTGRSCRGFRETHVLDMLFAGLNYDERTMMFLYYIRGRTMKLIGEALGLSESRVSQMHGAIVERLRQNYRPEDLFGLLRE